MSETRKNINLYVIHSTLKKKFIEATFDFFNS